MKDNQENLINSKYLNPDFTKGPSSSKNKNVKKLVSAFSNNRHNKDEKEFYIQVARDWVKEYEKVVHKVSLIFILLFLIWWAIGIFLSEYLDGINGWLALLFLLGLFSFSDFRILFRIGGKRMEKVDTYYDQHHFRNGIYWGNFLALVIMV